MKARTWLRFGPRHLWFAAQSLHLLTIAPWSKRGRKRVHQLTQTMGYPDPDHRPQLPACALRELVGDDVAVEIRSPWSHKYNVSAYELIAIAALVRRHRPGTLFEIGTFDGRTTLNLHANAPADAVIWTLDLPPEAVAFTVGERFAGQAPEGRIRQLFGNSAKLDITPYAGQVDFVFVDGSHRYEAVAADTRTALALTEGRRALVLWHDYGRFPGVTRAVDELRGHLGPNGRMVWIEDTVIACLLRG